RIRQGTASDGRATLGVGRDVAAEVGGLGRQHRGEAGFLDTSYDRTVVLGVGEIGVGADLLLEVAGDLARAETQRLDDGQFHGIDALGQLPDDEVVAPALVVIVVVAHATSPTGRLCGCVGGGGGYGDGQEAGSRREDGYVIRAHGFTPYLVT